MSQDKFKTDMQELYRRAHKLMMAGILDKAGYDIALHLMATMVKDRCTDIVTTWTELSTTQVTGGPEGDLLAGPSAKHHYFFLGALQQAEEWLGLVSHVDRVSLDAHIQHGRVEQQFSHFTREPGVESNIIGPHTRIIVVYEAWVGPTSDGMVDDLLNSPAITTVALPRWVTAANRAGR